MLYAYRIIDNLKKDSIYNRAVAIWSITKKNAILSILFINNIKHTWNRTVFPSLLSISSTDVYPPIYQQREKVEFYSLFALEIIAERSFTLVNYVTAVKITKKIFGENAQQESDM